MLRGSKLPLFDSSSSQSRLCKTLSPMHSCHLGIFEALLDPRGPRNCQSCWLIIGAEVKRPGHTKKAAAATPTPIASAVATMKVLPAALNAVGLVRCEK